MEKKTIDYMGKVREKKAILEEAED